VDYIIPGNDDAARAIALYCDLVSRAALDGMTAQLETAGVDIGALEEGNVEAALTGEGEAEAGKSEEPTEAESGAGA
jgi:small subunit ribosomal protein S2